MTTAKNKTASDSNKSVNTIDIPDSNAKIAELAYFKAENRGFEPGHELDDWLEAERDCLL